MHLTEDMQTDDKFHYVIRTNELNKIRVNNSVSFQLRDFAFTHSYSWSGHFFFVYSIP